ncbi:MAG: 4'-phosphopantetheinyl transferase family protein [Leptolyngbyaceae cyanobacterium]
MNLTAPPSLAWPDPGEVHIWQLPCAAAQAAKPLWQSWLNPTEQAQVERYRRAPDRDRAILSRGGLRYLLASYLNEPPHELQLATQCHGKPYLVSNADAIQFNVAHSGTWVVYGFTRQAQIGVDVETVCPRPRQSSLI